MEQLIVIGWGSLVVGYIVGSLHEKWKYYKKTGKHLQDLE